MSREKPNQTSARLRERERCAAMTDALAAGFELQASRACTSGVETTRAQGLVDAEKAKVLRGLARRMRKGR